jgi:hypothetical protein
MREHEVDSTFFVNFRTPVFLRFRHIDHSSRQYDGIEEVVELLGGFIGIQLSIEFLAFFLVYMTQMQNFFWFQLIGTFEIVVDVMFENGAPLFGYVVTVASVYVFGVYVEKFVVVYILHTYNATEKPVQEKPCRGEMILRLIVFIVLFFDESTLALQKIVQRNASFIHRFEEMERKERTRTRICGFTSTCHRK